MANIKSAIKRARQGVGLRKHNMAMRSRVRTFLKKVDVAITEGKKEEAAEFFKQAQSEVARAANKGIFKKNKASRDISRLSSRLKGMGQQA